MNRALLGLGAAMLTLVLLPAAAGAATITPNVATDDFLGNPNCSLREAIQAANLNTAVSGCAAGEAAPATDTIVLDRLPGNPYNLTLAGANEDLNLTGDLDSASAGGPLQITSSTGSVIDAVGPDRILDVRGSSSATLSGVTLMHGDVTNVVTDVDARGGNIRGAAATSIALQGVTVEQGASREGGGGIYTTGAFSMDSTRVTNNSDRNVGGGLFLQGNPSVSITRSVIDLNQIVTALLGNLKGGGIRASVDPGASLVISDTLVSGNFVHHTGLTLSDQAYGGGVSLSSQGVIRRSLIQNNSTLSDATSQEHGGGLHIDGGAIGETVTLVNSTLYENSAGASGEGFGGGVYVSAGTNINLKIAHTTFSANGAAAPAGGNSIHNDGAAAVTFGASLIPGGLFSNKCGGTGITSAGFNVAQGTDVQCGFIGSDRTVNDALGIVTPPADNGGFTRTISLLPTSPAIDFVPLAGCGPSEGQDQRGFHRPSGAACDAGAYERVICNAIVQEGPGAVDCPPALALPPVGGATPAAPCAGLKGKKRKRCLCKQKKSKKKRKKCLRRLKARKS